MSFVVLQITMCDVCKFVYRTCVLTCKDVHRSQVTAHKVHSTLHCKQFNGRICQLVARADVKMHHKHYHSSPHVQQVSLSHGEKCKKNWSQVVLAFARGREGLHPPLSIFICVFTV